MLNHLEIRPFNYVHSVLMRIGKYGKNPPVYTVDVTNDIAVNGAMCLGGFCVPGEITVTRGMLNAAMGEAELAAYLGHEIGHLDLGHPSHKSDSSLARWSQMAIDKAVGYVTETTGAIGAAEHQGKDMLTARFSRQDEEAADEYQKLSADSRGSIALADLQIGDLVYFGRSGSAIATHTAIVQDVESGADGPKVSVIAASPGAQQVTQQTLRADGSHDSSTAYIGGGRPGG